MPSNDVVIIHDPHPIPDEAYCFRCYTRAEAALIHYQTDKKVYYWPEEQKAWVRK